MKHILACVLCLLCANAAGAEVAGVKFADTAKSGATELVLNGAGLRTKVFFNVYALGLYLSAKKSSTAEVLAVPGPKRVRIQMLRDVGAAEFGAALEQGVKDNLGEAEVKSIESRLAVLLAQMNEIKEAKTGMVISLDWFPGTGTQISVNDQPRGKAIAGEDFYRALLRIWLGENPVSDDLKKAMLGQGG